MKPEFKIGDPVTYKPYDVALPAKVIDIRVGRRLMKANDDKRIFYTLTGTSKKRSEAVKAITQGYSIMESKLFGKGEIKQ